MVEPEAGQVAIPHIVRAANRKTFREIHGEIRRVQSRPAASEQRSGWLARHPHWLRRTSGTTVVSAVGGAASSASRASSAS